MGEERLLEEVVWRLEVLTPLHAGSGEQLTNGLEIASEGGWTYTVDLDKLLDRLPPDRRDRVGLAGLADLYRPLAEVQRYAVHGELPPPSFPEEGATLLRCFARDGFGRPYLPGSTLKGALRTALLMKLADDMPKVRGALSDGRRRARGRGRGATPISWRSGTRSASAAASERPTTCSVTSTCPTCPSRREPWKWWR